jgi:hypothetical protein
MLAWWCDRCEFLLEEAIAISREAAVLLKCAGQPEAALVLAQLSGECDDDWAVREGDEIGRRLAEKLCAAIGLPEPLEMIRLRRARVYDGEW